MARVAAVGLGLLALAFVFRVPLLRGAARWWIVAEAPDKAAAIVVLGGGEDYRPFAAARLWKEGWAPIILVPDVRPSPTEGLGLRPRTTDVILGVLKAEGVPDSAVVRIGDKVASTRDETLAVRAWLDSRPAPAAHPARLLIPTDPFATRRTDWFFHRSLPGTDIRTLRTDPRDLDPDRWWTQEQGLISFNNEVIKTAFYWLKY